MTAADFFKDRRGSVSVTEAALVYPVVIISCIALIYAGMFMYESAALESRAASAAVYAAKRISFPGCDELYEYQGDERMITDDISPEKIRNAYSDSSPYRYIFSSDEPSENEERAGKQAAAVLMPYYAEEFHIEVRPHILSREVEVTFRRKIRLPQLFRIAGIDQDYEINVSARALTSDPAEFLRNTDIAWDAADYFSDGSETGGNGMQISEKIKRALEKFGVKKK